MNTQPLVKQNRNRANTLVKAALASILTLPVVSCMYHPPAPTEAQKKTLTHIRNELAVSDQGKTLEKFTQQVSMPGTVNPPATAKDIADFSDAQKVHIDTGIEYMKKILFALTGDDAKINEYTLRIKQVKAYALGNNLGTANEWLNKTEKDSLDTLLNNTSDERVFRRTLQQNIGAGKSRLDDYFKSVEQSLAPVFDQLGNDTTGKGRFIVFVHEKRKDQPVLSPFVENYDKTLEHYLWNVLIPTAALLQGEGMQGQALNSVTNIADNLTQAVYGVRFTQLGSNAVSLLPAAEKQRAQELLVDACSLAAKKGRNWEQEVAIARGQYLFLLAQRYNNPQIENATSAACLIGNALEFDKKVSAVALGKLTLGKQILDLTCATAKSQVPALPAIEYAIRDAKYLQFADSLTGAYGTEFVKNPENLMYVLFREYIGLDGGVSNYKGSAAGLRARGILAAAAFFGDIFGAVGSGGTSSVLPGAGKGTGNLRLGGNREGGNGAGAHRSKPYHFESLEHTTQFSPKNYTHGMRHK